MKYLAALRALAVDCENEEGAGAETDKTAESFDHTPFVGFGGSGPGAVRFATLPADWREGLDVLARMQAPERFGEPQWKRLVADALSLGDRWGERAHVLGWTTLDLFGCSPGFARRLDRDGLAMLLRDRPIVALDEATATIENAGRARTRFYRLPCPGARRPAGAVAIWQAQRINEGDEYDA